MEGTKKCGKCLHHKALTAENWRARFRGGALHVNVNCRDCTERNRLRQQRKRAGNDPEKENVPGDASTKSTDQDDASEFLGVGPISLDAFRDALRAAGKINIFAARVDTTDLPEGDSIKGAADALAEIVWEIIDYRFLYHSTHRYKDSDDLRLTYHCAQLESRRHISKKNLDPKKQRDKGSMDLFECGGWLDIWASPNEPDYFIRICHLDCHQNYVCIDVPDDIKKFIAENPKLRATQLWKEILKSHPQPHFSQKSVYNLWFKQLQASWRRCEDEFQSAKMLLREFATDPAHKLASIPMPETDGFRALGFVFPSLLRKWNGIIREIALDSTFKTNKSDFQCFALLSEVGGSGLPLGFILLKSSSPDLGEKENTFTKQVLSDKDITEINALLAELPADIKYQLCFWHCICAVKKCLAVLGRHL
ncbi:hypothetical protein GGX14DRAFT_559280 [Mycena pura]|uniref:MULE transposase domain-containing protein n=1 Tax=Mycena pura TaxID=153505 RepID=A0AAD6VR60_9AGAR|nr:hypothetical protein GGX14DRAFT_559280 [Mycena pura]